MCIDRIFRCGAIVHAAQEGMEAKLGRLSATVSEAGAPPSSTAGAPQNALTTMFGGNLPLIVAMFAIFLILVDKLFG